MKFFTLKDFISYNNPCFGCGEIASLLFWTAPISNPDNKVSLKPLVTPQYTDISFKISYYKSLNLRIYTPSNRIECEDMAAMADYIYSHNIFIQSECSKCNSNRSTQHLKFSLNKKFLKPVGLSGEVFQMKDKTHTYMLFSHYQNESTIINIWKTKLGFQSSSHVKIEAPLLEMSRFKSKEHFLEKMSLYLLLS